MLQIFFRKEVSFIQLRCVRFVHERQSNYNSHTNFVHARLGLVKESIVNKLIREKWTVTIQNLDLASSGVGRAHYLIDQFWQGEGGCHSVLTMTPGKTNYSRTIVQSSNGSNELSPANCQSFAPYSEAQDKLIFQVEGKPVFLTLRE